jgi:hypothetical protein
MRTTLFLSTLFAVTLVGGAALAENPHESSPAKAPRVVERLRSKGDVVDKSYRGADKSSPAAAQAATVSNQAHATKSQIDKGASRINCSESGADCHAPRGSQQANGMQASSGEVTRAAKRPAFLDKILGSDRTNFNEAGEDQGMSPRAAKRAWSSVAANNAGHTTKAHLPTAQEHLPRQQQQASSARMSCNEGDECSMSSKEAKKVWAYDQIKKGVWAGPDAASKSPADVAIARMKAEQNAKK